MGLSGKLVLEAMGRELSPAIRSLIQLYRQPYLEELIEIAEGHVQVEEKRLLAQIEGFEVWARGTLTIQPSAFLPVTFECEIVLEPGGKRPRMEARLQWDGEGMARDPYGIKIADPRVLAAFRRIGLDLVQKLLATIQERRNQVEASPEFQEALQELEALVALWGEDKKR
jgi:hypothetical protein